jgi:hypothetical protein
MQHRRLLGNSGGRQLVGAGEKRHAKLGCPGKQRPGLSSAPRMYGPTAYEQLLGEVRDTLAEAAFAA